MYFFIAIIATYLTSTLGLIKTIDIDAGKSWILTPVIQQFGTISGAIFTADLTATSNIPITLMVLTSSQYDTLLSQYSSTSASGSNLCDTPAPLSVRFGGVPAVASDSSAAFASLAISERLVVDDRVTILLASCAEQAVHVTGTISLVNPTSVTGVWGVMPDASTVTDHATVAASGSAASYVCVGCLYLATIAMALAVRWHQQKHGRVSYSLQGRGVQLMWILLATVAARAVSALVYAGYYQDMSKTGREFGAWFAASQAMEALALCMWLAMSALLAMGWHMGRVVRWRTLRGTACAAVVYLPVLWARVFCGQSDTVTFLISDSCDALELAEFILRSICLLAIVINVNFTISLLRASTLSNAWVGSTCRAYTRLTTLNIFRAAFLLDMLAPALGVFISLATLTWRFEWMNSLVTQLASWLCTNAVVYAVFSCGLDWQSVRDGLAEAGHAVDAQQDAPGSSARGSGMAQAEVELTGGSVMPARPTQRVVQDDS